jgi:ATP phosphoribosyltransferase regulatory subunit
MEIMSDCAEKALLPAGMCDVLPPEAEVEAGAVDGLMASFAGHGYERVKPPLIEFEESLLAGNAAAMAPHTFRLMDPVSQRMMGVRADMTLQVARIATTRLRARPRPLRLGYAGQVLRVRGSQLRPERQFTQVGAELIGAAAPGADIEVILMAVDALEALGIGGLSVDIGLPTLVPAVCAGLNLDPAAAARLRAALDRKDAAAVAALADHLGAAGERTLSAMLAAVGPADETLAALERLDLAPKAARERAALSAVVEGVRSSAPDLPLTIDAVENRGFEYHTGVTFTFFARGVRGDLGRGGRYAVDLDKGERQPATGLTLFMDTVLRALPAPAPARRIFVPAGAPAAASERLRREGWITVAGLDGNTDAAAEALHMECTHILLDGTPKTIGRGLD